MRFQNAFTKGEFEMLGIVDTSEAEDGHGFDVKVDWVRLYGSKLLNLRLGRGVRSRLQMFYSITF